MCHGRSSQKCSGDLFNRYFSLAQYCNEFNDRIAFCDLKLALGQDQSWKVSAVLWYFSWQAFQNWPDFGNGSITL